MVRPFFTALAIFAATTALAAEGPSSLPTPLGETGPAPAGQPTSSERVSSPYWNGGSYSSDLPAADIRAVPPAHAAAVHARWTYNQLLTDLNNATRIMSIQLENQDDYRGAVSEEKNAYEQMESARRNALKPLQDNAGYTSAEGLRRELTVQIQDEFANPKPDEERIQAMARLKMEYMASNRRLEQDALSRDAAYQEARKNYVAAADRVSSLRQTNAMTIALDTSLQSLRRQVADARIAKLTTNAYYQSTIRARNIALDYAAYYRSYDRYRPYAGGYTGFYPFEYAGRAYIR